MKQYQAEQIRNIAIVGSAGCGKTSLVEALLFVTNATKRLGTIADGTTISDYDVEEIHRKSSLSLSVTPVEYDGCKINLLDAPGLFDFAAEVCQAIWAADGVVVVVVSGKSGVTVGTKKAIKLAHKYGKPCMIYVSKMDHERSDFYKTLHQLKAEFGPHICPIVVPHVQQENVECYIDLMDKKAFCYQGGKAIQQEIPAGEHRLEGLVSAISEAVAETDEALFEKYFSGEPFTEQEVAHGVHAGTKDRQLIPVFCGSSTAVQAIDLLLDGFVKLMPTAAEAGLSEKGSGVVAYVFKTVADPFVTKLSYLKILRGTLQSDSTVINMSTGKPEKLGKLLSVFGKKQQEVKSIVAGDIGAVTKLIAATGDTLCIDADTRLDAIDFPKPCYSIAIATTQKGDESKIAQALYRLLEEDPSMSFERNNETHQSILSGLGEQHLDVALARLRNKFGIHVTTEPPVIAYRETIQGTVRVQGRHKKQSGGHGQFGDVWIAFEPCDSQQLVFEQKIVGGAVPKGYFPAVEKGLSEAMRHGVLAGYPMIGIKATLVDGSYHPVDSSEMSFKLAAITAYKNGIPQASPMLLEPIGRLQVLVCDEHTGDMLGELNKRRGRVLGMQSSEAEKGFTEIEADVPMGEMQDFAILIRQMTQGSGSFVFTFHRYDPLPHHLKEMLIQHAKNDVHNKNA